MKRFKSINRQLRRGNLKLVFHERIVGWETSVILGGIVPKIDKVPQLLRRTSKGTYVPYN